MNKIRNVFGHWLMYSLATSIFNISIAFIITICNFFKKTFHIQYFTDTSYFPKLSPLFLFRSLCLGGEEGSDFAPNYCLFLEKNYYWFSVSIIFLIDYAIFGLIFYTIITLGNKLKDCIREQLKILYKAKNSYEIVCDWFVYSFVSFLLILGFLVIFVIIQPLWRINYEFMHYLSVIIKTHLFTPIYWINYVCPGQSRLSMCFDIYIYGTNYWLYVITLLVSNCIIYGLICHIVKTISSILNTTLEQIF